MYSPDTSEFDALCYGVQQPGLIEYAKEKLQQTSHLITEQGRHLLERAQAMHQRHMGHEAIRRAKAIVRAASHVFDVDNIRPLTTLSELQNAKPTMQRYLMANPPIRKAYQQSRVDGYQGSYVDSYPGTIGESHYDYRRVVEGIMTDTDEGLTWTTYIEDLEPGDEPLELYQQTTILNAWAIQQAYHERGQEDTTSKWGGML